MTLQWQTRFDLVGEYARGTVRYAGPGRWTWEATVCRRRVRGESRSEVAAQRDLRAAMVSAQPAPRPPRPDGQPTAIERVAQMLRVSGWLTVRELRAVIQVSARTVSEAVGRLDRAGLVWVDNERQPRCISWMPPEAR